MKLFIIISAIILGLIASIIPAPGMDQWYPQYLCILMFSFAMGVYFISEMSVAISLFIFYLIYNVFFIAHQNLASVMGLMSVILCLLISMAISKLNNIQARKIWIAILITLFIQLGLGVLQIFGHDPLFHKIGTINTSDVVGFSASHNQYSLSLAATAVSLFLLPLTFAIPLLILVIVCIAFSTTFSGIMGLTFSWMFYFYKGTLDKNILAVVIISILLICLGIYLKPSVTSTKLGERVAIWKLTLKQAIKGKVVQEVSYNEKRIITADPLFGFGMNSFFFVSPSSQNDILCKFGTKTPEMFNVCNSQIGKFEHAHNDYVEILFDLGWVGVLLFLYVMYEMISLFNMVKNKSKLLLMSVAGIVAYGVCALSIYTVHTAYSGFLLCVFIGLFYREVKNGA